MAEYIEREAAKRHLVSGYAYAAAKMLDGKWQPSKEGLGLGRVPDYIGVKYE